MVTYNSSAGVAVLAGQNVEARKQSSTGAGATNHSDQNVINLVFNGTTWTGHQAYRASVCRSLSSKDLLKGY